jgi:anti-sigma B factor antagonist
MQLDEHPGRTAASSDAAPLGGQPLGGAPVVPDFGIDVTRTGDAAIVSVIGELDLATAPRLREEIDALVESGVCAVTVDLVRLEFIDSTGLSALVMALKDMREHGGDLALRSLSPSTLKVFQIAGLTEVFAIG